MPNSAPPLFTPSPVREVEDALIDYFQHAADLLGAPRSIAAIYGLFFASTAPLCLQDIAERLDLSQGSVSNGLRFLKELGAITSASGPQPRREYYVIDLQMRNLIRRYLDDRVGVHLAQGAERLGQIKAKLEAAGNNGADADLRGTLSERLEQLESWQGKTRALLPMAKAFLAL